MKEQLISLETAKLARDKGFNELDTKIPFQSVLQKWLREEHNIYIVILGKRAFIIQTEENNFAAHGYDYISYEEALEAGLQEALKLI